MHSADQQETAGILRYPIYGHNEKDGLDAHARWGVDGHTYSPSHARLHAKERGVGDHSHLRDHDHEVLDPLAWFDTEKMQQQIDAQASEH